jgi:hypothetical protein
LVLDAAGPFQARSPALVEAAVDIGFDVMTGATTIPREAIQRSTASRFSTVVEGGLWLTAIILYVRATRPKGRAGVYGFWGMMIVLTALWLISLRGDPPPSLSALAIVNTVFLAVVLAWASWMNRSRSAYGL